jgi:hypothetical protein
MQLALPVLLAASALVAQGDAADVRALLRQRVMAEALTTDTLGNNATVCNTPAAFLVMDTACTSSAGAMYVLLDASTGYPNQYVQVCGSTCTYSTTIEANAGVGGYACGGNKKVDVTIPGITAPSVFQSNDCIPCSDREISTNPQDKANLVACGITNFLFGDIVKGTVMVANVIAKGTVALGYQIRDGTVKVGNQIVTGVVDLGNTIEKGTLDTTKTIEKGTVDLGNKIAQGTVNLGNTIGDTLKKTFKFGRR